MNTKTALDLALEAAERPAAALRRQAQPALDLAREALFPSALEAAREALSPSILETAREALAPRALEAVREAMTPSALEEAARLSSLATALRAHFEPAQAALTRVRAALSATGQDFTNSFALHERLLDAEGLNALATLRDSAEAVQHPLRLADLQKRAALDYAPIDARALQTTPPASAASTPKPTSRTAPDTTPQAPASASAHPVNSAIDIGRLIKAVREERGLTQQQLAEDAGVGRRFLSELENGKATLEFDKVIEVARAVGVDLMARPKA